jgi:hypothetical protein
MSEPVGLGEGDAEVRWVGLRRHQAVVVVLGVVLAGDAVLHSWAPVPLALGLSFGAAAIVVGDGRTIGEHVTVTLAYAARRHWRVVTALELGDEVALWADGEVAFRVFALEHCGRLDLSGRDDGDARALAALVDAAGAARGGQHLSWHVVRGDEGTHTVLVLPVAVASPENWRPAVGALCRLVGLEDGSLSASFLERFSYLRGPEHVRRVFRVSDFSAVSRSALLEGLLRIRESANVAVHVDVVGAERSHRLAARAVHRVGSDAETTRAFGFRRSARAVRALERLAQREDLVAAGRALVRVAVFVVVRAPTLDELRRRSDAVWREVHDGGLRLERGRGRQASWFRAQLPGGPGW